MAKPEDIRQIVKEMNPKAIFIKGFDEALIGTGKSIGGETVAIYDADDCLKILINKHEMDEVEAWEHFNSTVVDGTPGSSKPIFISDWRLAVNIEDVLKDIKIDKQQTLNDILNQVKKKKEDEEEQED